MCLCLFPSWLCSGGQPHCAVMLWQGHQNSDRNSVFLATEKGAPESLSVHQGTQEQRTLERQTS